MGHAVLISIGSDRWGCTEELGIACLSAVLKENGHSVTRFFVHENLPNDEFTKLRKYLALQQPRLIGIGCSHSSIPLSIYRTISEMARQNCPDAHITCGGYWATFNSEFVLQELSAIDSVVVGEGEYTALELMELLESNTTVDQCAGLRTRTNELVSREIVEDLDLLPIPDRLNSSYEPSDLVSITTSRGCLARCTFCNVPRWMSLHGGKQWRGRSPENVVAEFSKLYGMGARRFWIVDSSFEDPFPPGIERIEQIAEGIIEQDLRLAYYVFFRAESVADAKLSRILPKLSKSGLRRAFIGVEAGTDERLRKFGKRARLSDISCALNNLRANGIVPRAGFIMFSSDTTPEKLVESMEFLERENLLYSTVDLFGRMELYTGAAEVTRQLKLGLLTGDPAEDPYCYSFQDRKVAPVAKAMTSLLSDSSLDRRWEALHTAQLVANGARLDANIQSDSVLQRLTDQLWNEIEELHELMSEVNKQFFSRIIEIASSEWNPDQFNSLVAEFIDGYHLEMARTGDTLVTEFLLQAKVKGIEVIY